MNFRVFNKDVPLHILLFVAGETVLIFGAVLLAAFLRLGSLEASILSKEVLEKSLLIVAACQISIYYNDLYNLRTFVTPLETALRLIKAIGIACICLALVCYLFPSIMIGSAVFFTSLFFLVLFISLWRLLYYFVLKNRMLSERLLIFGSGYLTRQVVNEIMDRPDSGYEIAGVIRENNSKVEGLVPRVPVFNMIGTLYDLATKLNAKKIVVAMDEKRGTLPTADLLYCKMKGMTIVEGETLYEELTGKLFVERLNPSWLIFSEGFRKSSFTRFSKRLTGSVLAATCLILTLPMAIFAIIAIKLDSPGPVFFRQTRLGEDGKTFQILKFRSMIHDAERVSGPRWATEEDERITRVGRVLRKYRLDELPQMWNVLKGDMSFVGPRPERPEFVESLSKQIPYYSERHTVKPGITGWAQVCYRYGASVNDSLEKLKYDLFYVKNMSMTFDLLIVIKTIKIVLLQTGAR